MEITTEEFERALEMFKVSKTVIDDYFKQTIEKVETVKNVYKSLQEITVGDLVECVFVHSASTKHLTRFGKYEVLNDEDYRFLIQTDSGKKKWYYKSNGHFKGLK